MTTEDDVPGGQVRATLERIRRSLNDCIEDNDEDKSDLGNLDFDDCYELLFGADTLEYLDLSEWENLTELPPAVFDLVSLQALHLAKCRSLAKLPPQIQCLQQLTELDLSRCASLASLPDQMCSSLPSLQRLSLAFCTGLESLPTAWLGMSSLTRLDLEGCSNLQSIPRGMWVGCQNLVYLGLGRLPCLGPCLPPALGNLSKLKTLSVRNCPNLRWLCRPGEEEATLGPLVELHSLFASGSPLESLPIDALARLRGLHILSLEDCPKVPALLQDKSKNTVQLVRLLVFGRSRAVLLELAAWRIWGWSKDPLVRAEHRATCEGIDIVVQGVLPFVCGAGIPQLFPFCYHRTPPTLLPL